MLNSSTLYLQGFSYDGEGPDAFFYVGGSEAPIEDGVIVPYPPGVEGAEPPVLGEFRDEDIYLTLPAGVNVRSLRWISVWCRRFGVNFGELNWGDKLARLAEQQPEQPRSLGPVLAPGTEQNGCSHNGKVYKVGKEFHDGCQQYCICQEDLQVICFEIDCPSEFGLDVMSPNCIEWDNHVDFVPSPPVCCPPVPVCLSTGSCEYRNQTFPNYESLPEELTGCEQRCHCENGEVNCQDACYANAPVPPAWLPCAPAQAKLVPNPERTCCQIWGCAPKVEDDSCDLLPEILVGTAARPVDQTSLGITFSIPEYAGGHKGYYKIGFSSGFGGHPDPTRWPTEVFETSTGTLEEKGTVTKVFSDLVPNTEYFIRPSIVIGDCGEELEIIGDILTTRTMPVGPSAADTTPLVVYLDMELYSSGVSSNMARVSWKHFEPEDKPYIDGVQLRYQAIKENQPLSQVPETSPFIHRDTNYFLFEGLEPATTYEVELDIIPVPGSRKELYSGKKLELTTLPFTDIYDFKLELELETVGGDSVEVSWSGVPSPDQKFVNIYRVIYHANSPNSIRDEASVFKISKIDSPKRILITDLEPDLDYQVTHFKLQSNFQ